MDVDELRAHVAAAAGESGFSGVVSVDRAGATVLREAFGHADRRWGIPNTVGTRFGIASGTKLLTALAVVALVDAGRLEPATCARDVLGPDLPAIDDAVTVEQLLCHRSGIGDYLDESLYADISDFELPVPAQRLATTSAYLEVLDGHPMVSPPGERFVYNNGAYVVLAVIAERVSGESFYDLVDRAVCGPAGLGSTGFLRSDELPADVALGYLDGGLRTNVFHLPVRGSGDGGVITTVADVDRLWRALVGGRIVSPASVDLMLAPGRGDPEDELDYGLGVWLHRDAPVLEIHGWDAGVSFRSLHHAVTGTTATVVSNSGEATGPFRGLVDAAVRA